MEGTCHHIKAQPHANDTMSKINHTQSKYNIFSYAIKKTNILHKIPNEATPLAHTYSPTQKTQKTQIKQTPKEYNMVASHYVNTKNFETQKKKEEEGDYQKGLQWVGGKGFPPKQLGYEEKRQ